MATLIFNEESYTIDHAVKGTDYIHGYAANGNLIVSFEGITDFSLFTFDGEYMIPEQCVSEPCNNVLFVNNTLVTQDGKDIATIAEDTTEAVRIFTNVTVTVAMWEEDNTYIDFPYKVDIPCLGVMDNYVADVTFDIADATSGNYAPVSATGSGIVTIYAAEIPETDIEIPSIKCVKAVNRKPGSAQLVDSSFINKETTFNEDGSITEVSDIGTKTTVFNADGSITETLVTDTGTFTKTTTFEDNVIHEVIS